MAELVVACFDTQFAAHAAAEKLLSRGLGREQIVLAFDESVGDSPASSSAPTTVMSAVSHTARVDTGSGRDRQKRASSSDRTPGRLPEPHLIGQATLVVKLHGKISMDEAYAVLDGAGAHSIRAENQAMPRREDPAMWPAMGSASPEDVQRSVDAAKGGSTLGVRRPR